MPFVAQSECCQGLAVEVICHGKESDSDLRLFDHWLLAKMNNAQAQAENQNYPNANPETTTEPRVKRVPPKYAGATNHYCFRWHLSFAFVHKGIGPPTLAI